VAQEGPDGEICRHSGLKIRRPFGNGGSSPPPGTKIARYARQRIMQERGVRAKDLHDLQFASNRSVLPRDPSFVKNCRLYETARRIKEGALAATAPV
jgi:hypothetical protein